MTITYSDFALVLPWAAALAVLAAAARWVGRDRFLSIWESEGVLSWRLLAATALVAFALYMRAAGRLSTAEAKDLLEIAFGLSALGTLKVVATRFAPKPTDNTQADKQDGNPH